jgi:uncharacterized protein (UPF0254 family)
VAVEEGDGGVSVGTARAAGIGQGVIGTQEGIIRQMNRNEIGVVLLVVPDWVRRRVDGGLGGGEGHAKGE